MPAVEKQYDSVSSLENVKLCTRFKSRFHSKLPLQDAVWWAIIKDSLVYSLEFNFKLHFQMSSLDEMLDVRIGGGLYQSLAV